MMLVYGDRIEAADPRRKLAELRKCCALLRAMPSGIDRHAKLVGLLIEAGRLLQGIADADSAIAGFDDGGPATDALSTYLVQLAGEVIRSSDEKFASELRLPDLPDLCILAGDVNLREPEGYSFYAVYPEAYAQAAREIRLVQPCVIGIRSIGTSLGAVVAAALGAGTFATVRPFGDPFARQIAVSPELERELLGGLRNYVIVDEGPGQSGSSFGAVADWLKERGVPLDRIAFVTSHDGSPGPKASNTHKRLWQEVRRVGTRFDNSLLADRFGSLEPLCDGQRLKFRGQRDGERVLLKFVGLGAVGERKMAMAKALHATGWTSEPLALVHGFLAERWHEDARPLSADARPLPEMASYIGTRALLFPAADNEGASVQQLFAMIRRNAELAVEQDAVAALARWEPRLASIGDRIVRVRTDNRMDPQKWLRHANGRVLKVDALDHHCSHDLVGAQDIAWDVAGAAIEFDLDAKERAWLAAVAGRTAGRLVDAELLEFMTVAYVAFRLGQSQLAALGAAADGYERRLRELLLEHSNAWKPQESPLGSHAERTGAGTIQP